ncbi:MAG: B12-binding domain-containing radical SAM protein, partial [Calditrichia bacterium]|nr:B12-binding domain-containing radical SAM protein [Calditrichia bacterium]
MSSQATGILYHLLNKLDFVGAERVFAPWMDGEKILRGKQIPLFSLESKASLKSFDVVGFSLTTELCYTNVLNMLDL